MGMGTTIFESELFTLLALGAFAAFCMRHYKLSAMRVILPWGIRSAAAQHFESFEAQSS